MRRSFVLGALITALPGAAQCQATNAQSAAEVVHQSQVDSTQRDCPPASASLDHLLRKGVTRAAITLHRRTHLPLANDQVAKRAATLAEESGRIAIDCYFANNVCQRQTQEFLAGGKFSPQEFLAGSAELAIAHQRLAQAFLALAALPVDESQEFGQLVLEQLGDIYNTNRHVDRELRSLLVDGRLPEEAIEPFKTVVREADERIRRESLRLEPTTAQAREALARWLKSQK
jgi:hypothetical protein